VNYKKIDGQLWYKIKWVKYQNTTWEPKDNLKNSIKKVEKYYKKASQVVKKRISQKQMDQLKATDEFQKQETPLLKYQLFPLQLE